jgi:hypothetical protein
MRCGRRLLSVRTYGAAPSAAAPNGAPQPQPMRAAARRRSYLTTV